MGVHSGATNKQWDTTADSRTAVSCATTPAGCPAHHCGAASFSATSCHTSVSPADGKHNKDPSAGQPSRYTTVLATAAHCPSPAAATDNSITAPSCNAPTPATVSSTTAADYSFTPSAEPPRNIPAIPAAASSCYSPAGKAGPGITVITTSSRYTPTVAAVVSTTAAAGHPPANLSPGSTTTPSAVTVTPKSSTTDQPHPTADVCCSPAGSSTSTIALSSPAAAGSSTTPGNTHTSASDAFS